MTLPKFIVNFLLRRVAAKARETPYAHLHGYMKRWHVVPIVSTGTASNNGCGAVTWRRPFAKLLQRFGIAIRVHDIISSDRARRPNAERPDFHDHPWHFVTVILSGGYWEWRPTSNPGTTAATWHGPGSVLFRKAEDLHYLELARDVNGNEIPATTLFTTMPYKQKWGFKMPDGSKMPYTEYFERFEDLYRPKPRSTQQQKSLNGGW